jgi:hypothetical protein
MTVSRAARGVAEQFHSKVWAKGNINLFEVLKKPT